MKLKDLLSVIKTTDIEIALDESQETIINRYNYYDVIKYLECEVVDIRIYCNGLFISIK